MKCLRGADHLIDLLLHEAFAFWEAQLAVSIKIIKR